MRAPLSSRRSLRTSGVHGHGISMPSRLELHISHAHQKGGYTKVASHDPEDPDNFHSERKHADVTLPMMHRPSAAHRASMSIKDVAAGGDSAFYVNGRALLNHIGFQATMAVFIVLNAGVIGLETDVPSLHSLWEICENVLLAVFLFELVLRFVINGPSVYCDYTQADFFWNMFDVSIVGLGLVDAMVAAALPNVKTGSSATLFRIIRLLRILRIFRIVRFLKQLYLLAFGFIEAAQAVFWVTLLMASTLYVCSIILVRTVGRLPEEDPYHELLSAHFGSIAVSMFTLFELMANPELDVYEGALSDHPVLGGFMIGFIIFGSFGMLALLTGVISESMFEKNQLRLEEERQEREFKRKVLERRCGDIFDKAIANYYDDNLELIPSQDIAPMIPLIAELFAEVGVNFILADLEQLIDLMDLDGNGHISKEEFSHGVISIAEGVRPVSIMEIHHVVSLAKCRLEKFLPMLTQMMADSKEINEHKKFILAGIETIEVSVQELQRTHTELHEQSKEIMNAKQTILDTMIELRDLVSHHTADLKASLHSSASGHSEANMLEKCMLEVTHMRLSTQESMMGFGSELRELKSHLDSQSRTPEDSSWTSQMHEFVNDLKSTVQESLREFGSHSREHQVPFLSSSRASDDARDNALVEQVQQCVQSVSDLKTVIQDNMSDFGYQLRELRKHTANAVEGCRLKEADPPYSPPVNLTEMPPDELPEQMQQCLAGIGELKSMIQAEPSLLASTQRSTTSAQPAQQTLQQLSVPEQPELPLLQDQSEIGQLKSMIQEMQTKMALQHSRVEEELSIMGSSSNVPAHAAHVDRSNPLSPASSMLSGFRGRLPALDGSQAEPDKRLPLLAAFHSPSRFSDGVEKPMRLPQDKLPTHISQVQTSLLPSTMLQATPLVQTSSCPPGAAMPLNAGQQADVLQPVRRSGLQQSRSFPGFLISPQIAARPASFH